VQELYDSRTLHRIVGVSAKAHLAASSNGASTNGDVEHTKKKSKTSKPKSKPKEAKGVFSVWEEADMELESDNDHPRQRDGGEEEEEGRYGIEKRHQKSSRRQKTSASAVTFITDDESDVSEVKMLKKAAVDVPITEFIDDRNSEDDREEGEYISSEEDAGDDRLKSKKNESGERRRSYWLSKADGLGEDDSP
jgi:non-canonical poly(A) RNA polymerase PAPD5/7